MKGERFSYRELVEFLGSSVQQEMEEMAQRGSSSETGAVANVLGRDRRTVYHWVENDLMLATADKVACVLGVHPSAIWPSWFAEAA